LLPISGGLKSKRCTATDSTENPSGSRRWILPRQLRPGRRCPNEEKIPRARPLARCPGATKKDLSEGSCGVSAVCPDPILGYVALLPDVGTPLVRGGVP